MTSKSLFLKLMREDLKQRIWSVALALLVFFLSLPVACLLLLENAKAGSFNSILSEFQLFIGTGNGFLMLVTVTGAFICGVNGFYYLHSKKKIDFYHSLPVKRELLFFVKYINGLLIYVIPYGINLLLCLLIGGIYQIINGDILQRAFITLLFHFVYYCMLYTTFIIAVQLTGNFFVSLLGAGTLLFYGPLAVSTVFALFEDNFNTFLNHFDVTAIYGYTSPLYAYYNAMSKYGNLAAKTLPMLINILFAVIPCILLMLTALFLYKKRLSEKAGRAISFKIAEPVIKFMLIIPLSIMGGFFLKSISYSESTAWFVFGLVLTLILVNAIMEIVYDFDFRSAFKHRKQFIINAAAVALILLSFRLDVLHYDTYVPKPAGIESMSVDFTDLDTNIYNDSGSNNRLGNMVLTEFENAYELAEIGADNAKNMDTLQYNENYSNVLVKYHLKNGRDIYRSYLIDLFDNMDKVNSVYCLEEYKRGIFPVYGENWGDWNSVSINSGFGQEKLSTEEKFIQELKNAYIEDMNALSLFEVKNEMPLGILTFSKNAYGSGAEEYVVYPGFENTIQLLKNHGYEFSSIDINKVKSIKITNYHTEADTAKGESAPSKEEYQTMSYTDKDSMEQIVPYIYPEEFFWPNNMLYQMDTDIQAEVEYYNNEYGNVGIYYYRFLEDNLPELIKQ